jgi:ankyrin repeat protein
VHVDKGALGSAESKLFYEATSSFCQTASEAALIFGSAFLDLALHGAKHASDKRKKFVNVWIPLFWATVSGDKAVENVSSILKDNPGAINRLLPISNATVGHYAVGAAHGNVDEVLDVLVAVRPDLATVPDDNGDLILHYAARLNPRAKTLQYLLKLNPAATKAKGNFGHTPGHVIASSYFGRCVP